MEISIGFEARRLQVPQTSATPDALGPDSPNSNRNFECKRPEAPPPKSGSDGSKCSLEVFSSVCSDYLGCPAGKTLLLN